MDGRTKQVTELLLELSQLKTVDMAINVLLYNRCKLKKNFWYILLVANIIALGKNVLLEQNCQT